MTDKQKETAAQVIKWTALVIGGFILLVLVMQFLLVWTGRAQFPEGGAFQPVFDLIVLLVGIVSGYVARDWTGGSGGED